MLSMGGANIRQRDTAPWRSASHQTLRSEIAQVITQGDNDIERSRAGAEWSLGPLIFQNLFKKTP